MRDFNTYKTNRRSLTASRLSDPVAQAGAEAGSPLRPDATLSIAATRRVARAAHAGGVRLLNQRPFNRGVQQRRAGGPVQRTDARRRGSTLILAVVIVVLLAMLGAGFIQMARVDRRATASMDTTHDVDHGSIIRYIAAVLGADVLEGNGDEYDYPWTDPTGSADVPPRYAPVDRHGPQDDEAGGPRLAADFPDATGALASTGYGAGDGDDPFLASTQPDLVVGVFPHLTNLMGDFLDLNPANFVAADGVSPAGPDEYYPRQYLANSDPANGNQLYNCDTDVPLIDMTGDTMNYIFADADGDGFPDSRWTWAPLPTKLGRAYVMAVRIVDHGSMVNVNTATPQGDPSALAGLPAAESPRFLWPGELSLDAPFIAYGSDAINDIVLERNVSPNFAATNGRYWDWLARGRFNAAANETFDESKWTPLNNETIATPVATFTGFRTNNGNEAELRWRNGLNRSSDNVTADPDAPIEAIQGGSPDWRSTEAVTAWSAAGGGTWGTYDAYCDGEPRGRMTTLSGKGLHFQGNLIDGAGALAGDIQQALDTSPWTAAKLAYWAGSEAAFRDQYAAVIEDWKDIDEPGVTDPLLDVPVLTELNGVYGMEYLPFMTGVYLQRDYTAAVAGSDVNWTASGGTTLLIELVNPWPREVALPEVQVGVDGTVWTPNLRTQLGVTTLAAHELVTVQIDLNGGAGVTLPPGVVDISDPAFTWTPPASNTAAVEIELYAPVKDDAANPIKYQGIPINSAGNVITETNRLGTTPGIGNGDAGYYQVASVGTGDGFAALTVAPGEYTPTTLETDGPGLVTHDTAEDPNTAMNFGTHAKGATFDISDGRVTDTQAASGFMPVAGDEPFLIGNRGRIWRAGDLFRMVVLGPRTGETVGQVWQNAVAAGSTSALSDFMVSVDDPAAAGQTNFAAALLQRLNSADSADQGFVPGYINVNTAPRSLLEMVVPMPNQAAWSGAGGIVDRIIAGRADPALLDSSGVFTQRPSTEKGIKHLGELQEGLSSADPLVDFGLVQFNEYETLTTTIGPGDNDGFEQDAEANTRALSYLNQVLSVRSDIYTAYILVRAYPANDFSNGTSGASALPLDEFRIVATFDRSQVDEDNRSAKVVSVAVYKD